MASNKNEDVDVLVQKVREKLTSTTNVEKLGEIQTKFCDYKELQFILSTKKEQIFIKYNNNKIYSTPIINREKFCDWDSKDRIIEEWSSFEDFEKTYGKYSIMMELLDVYKGKELKQYVDIMHLF